jgi:signal transduction histidine kinase
MTPRQQTLARRMSASVEAMDSMFGTLLDISRMDAGAVTARQEPFELVPLMHRLVEEFAPHAQKGACACACTSAAIARMARARRLDAARDACCAT